MIKLFSLLIPVCIIVFTSCGTQKPVSEEQQVDNTDQTEEESEETEANNPNNAIGKVILSKEGCPLKLILEDEDNVCYYPVNLDEKFKVDGAYLQFQKYPSRAPMPAGCESCRTIQVENVVRLKR